MKKYYIINVREPEYYYCGLVDSRFGKEIKSVAYDTDIEKAKSFTELKDAEAELEILIQNHGGKDLVGIIKKEIDTTAHLVNKHGQLDEAGAYAEDEID